MIDQGQEQSQAYSPEFLGSFVSRNGFPVLTFTHDHSGIFEGAFAAVTYVYEVWDAALLIS